MNPNILITGANGQLGSELRNLADIQEKLEFIFTDVEELDITSEKESLEFITAAKPAFIINCAAYTAVDQAEEQEEMALRLNQSAVANLTRAAREVEAGLVHVSTDYVFDGKTHRPYVEDDQVNPCSVYGRSKYLGEQEALKYAKSMVIRTSWLYSIFGNNFVSTIMKYARERGKLNVVFDQVGTPTNATDLAITILFIITNSIENPSFFKPGIYHYSNEGVCSWYDFALEIIEMSGISCKVEPIESKDFPQKAYRPPYSILNKAKIKSSFNIQVPHWKESLKKCIFEFSK
jgi:dTDP-4-dehydrorhamnose reductase